MVIQVVSTLFDLMIEFEYLWMDTYESRPSSIYGFGLGVDEKPPAIEVSTEALYNNFLSGFKENLKLYERIIPLPEITEMKKYTRIKNKDHFYYRSNLWARILFNFAIAYRNNEVDRNQLIKALIPFYYSRVLSYVNKTRNLETRESEEYLENVSRVFESEKYYLIERWNESAEGRVMFI